MTLSDKRIDVDDDIGWEGHIRTEDVKQFIKDLEEQQ